MQFEEVSLLHASCLAIANLAELVIASPAPPPAPPPRVPMEAIHARFSPSESQLIDKLTTLAANLNRTGDWLADSIIAYDVGLPDDVAAETRGWISSAANTAGELLRCRERAAQSRERTARRATVAA